MNKLKLDLENVTVESFDVTADDESRAGSVDGFEDPGAIRTNYESCGETCVTAECGTCAPSCWPTCGFSPECA